MMGGQIRGIFGEGKAGLWGAGATSVAVRLTCAAISQNSISATTAALRSVLAMQNARPTCCAMLATSA